MEVEALGRALGYMGQPTYWAAFGFAIFMAAATGLIPGFSSNLVMALAIPFIVVTIPEPAIGIVMLATLVGVNNTLDSIPAVIMGIPGGATQVTFLEGNQLAQQGKAAHTLGAIYAVSAMGGIVGVTVLAVIIPVIKPFVLSFSWPEIAAMGLFGVAMVAALSAGAILKGIASGLLGLLLGTVGIDPLAGSHRFTFGSLHLWEGLPLIATIIGVFALPELIDLSMTRKSLAPPKSKISTREVLSGAHYGLRSWKIVIRQSLFGVLLGAIPGVGSSVIDWMAYGFGIALSKKGERGQFGKGSLDGVLFAESAQNSKEGGQAIPTLALGIPGGLGWAFILATMLIYGISPGPGMLDRHADITIIIVITLALANLVITMIGLLVTGQLTRLTLIPFPAIAAVIIPISLLSAFQNITNLVGIWIVFAAAALGILMKQHKWPRPPLILGFILSPIIEYNLRSALNVYGPVGLMTRPLTVFLLILTIGFVFLLMRYMRTSTDVAAAATSQAPQDTSVSSGDGEVNLRPPQGGAPPTVRSTLAGRLGLSLRPTPTWASITTLTILGIAAVAYVLSMDYFPTARRYPVAIIMGIFAVGGLQLIRETFGSKTGDIMDIGMRSSTAAGIGATRLKMLGLLVLLVFGMGLIGLQWASVLFAFAMPALLLTGQARRISMFASPLAVVLFNFMILDTLMNVIWPRAFLLDWIRSML